MSRAAAGEALPAVHEITARRRAAMAEALDQVRHDWTATEVAAVYADAMTVVHDLEQHGGYSPDGGGDALGGFHDGLHHWWTGDRPGMTWTETTS